MINHPDYFQVEIPHANDGSVARTAATLAKLFPWTSRLEQIESITLDGARTIAVTDWTMGGRPQLLITRVVETERDFGFDPRDARLSDTYLFSGPRASADVAQKTAVVLRQKWEQSFSRRIGQALTGFRQGLSDSLYRFGRVGE